MKQMYALGFMTHRWTLQLILLLTCLAMNGLSHVATAGYPERVEIARETPPPEGQVYLDTCDGRPTDSTGESDAICLSDYPGEFTRGVILILSMGLFFLVNLALWLRRPKEAQKPNP